MTAQASAPTLELVHTRSPHIGAKVLTPQALAFVADLAARFRPRVEALLAARAERQKRFEAGEKPDFLAETAAIRAGDWKGAPVVPELTDRRIEITGPVDRKTIINALNSGANVFMADFEDANAPTWENQVTGQENLADAVRRTISFEDPTTKKKYALKPQTATLMVRPRGWHLWEKHALLDGRPIPGALFDFGLYFFHNAQELVHQGLRPAFYLPKMESHLEARLWNDVFLHAQQALGLPRGTIRCTCLIETLPAAFEMDEIIYELREHSAGLNCGRWDYIFSFLKKLGRAREYLLPDRGQVTMEQHFLRSYTQLLIQTCHRRGVHAMGGMAAQIPIKNDPAANDAAFAKVRADKEREAKDGHDGTWVAHPGLVPLAKEIFDAHVKGPNQLHRLREDVKVTAADLLKAPTGTRSEHGLRHNVRVGVQYLEAWLRGVGCVPIYNLMEDAATAEISRMQVWQWLHLGAELEGLGKLTPAGFQKVLDEEMGKIRSEVGDERFTHGRFPEAKELFARLSTAEKPEEFLTLPAYELLLKLS